MRTRKKPSLFPCDFFVVENFPRHFVIVCFPRYRRLFNQVSSKDDGLSFEIFSLKKQKERSGVSLTSRARPRLQTKLFAAISPSLSPSLLSLCSLFCPPERPTETRGFMSVDHDGHLSLQFALYQSSSSSSSLFRTSLSFSSNSHRDFFAATYVFGIDEPISAPGKRIHERLRGPFCRVSYILQTWNIADRDFPGATAEKPSLDLARSRNKC